MQETNFDVKPLPKARIPILKLTLTPSPALPFGIACDIGIENRLAIENTRLLLTYATIDPARVRTLVLFCTSLFECFSCRRRGGNAVQWRLRRDALRVRRMKAWKEWSGLIENANMGV
jgi:hypothetical protein